MLAQVLPGVNEPLRQEEVQIPRPGFGEVRLRVAACGVCGSDLFLQEGGFGRSKLPVVPGHEAAGYVDEIGPGVEDVRMGELLAAYYLSTPPGDPWARDGVPNRSPQAIRMGVDIGGAFAEYVVRPAAALVRPPSAIAPTALAVLTDAGATPLHALKRVACLRPAESVVVIGIGGIGLMAVQFAKAFGAVPVIAMSRSEGKLELAAQLGATISVIVDQDAGKSVREALGGTGADVVLQCAGSVAAYRLALEVAGPGGRVVFLGSTSDSFAIAPMPVIWSELSLMGSRGFIPADIEDAVALYCSGHLDLSRHLSSVRPLAEANAALEDLRDGKVLRSVLVP